MKACVAAASSVGSALNVSQLKKMIPVAPLIAAH